MIHKIIMWASAVASIAGIIIAILDKLNPKFKINISPFVVYSAIAICACISIYLAITEKVGSNASSIGSVTSNSISGNQTIITNPSNVGNINIGDNSTSAEQRFQSGKLLIEDEIISNYSTLGILIAGLKENRPQKFWDLRKPNESDDTYQERARNHHKGYQAFMFQMIQKFPIHQDVFNTHKLAIAHDPNVAEKLQRTYYWLTEAYNDLITYTDGLQHNISLGGGDVETYNRNESLFREKYVNTRTLLLQSIDQFLNIYPNSRSQLQIACQDLDFGFSFSSDTFSKKILQTELGQLFSEKAAIIGERIPKPQRDEDFDKIVKDPYLRMIRKLAGTSDTLTEAEIWALRQKKFDASISSSQKLLSAAAFSYMESDGRTSIKYLERALENNDFSDVIKVFIKRSIQRLKTPDIFDGSIGLIVLEIGDGSILKKKGVSVGDVAYKVDGNLLIEPLDISSMLGKTQKDEDMLIEFNTVDGKIKKIAIPGGSAIGCKMSQLITLNSCQL